MKILICSDNHLRDCLQDIKDKHPECELAFHLGDSEFNYDELKDFIAVRGNNDFDMRYDVIKVIELLGHRILLTHGHRYIGFFYGTENLVKIAKDNDCDVVCYGHTHIYADELIDDVRLINPGSLRNNRDGSRPSYAIMTLTENEVLIERMEYEPYRTSF